MNIKVKCEKCENIVILTSKYNGQPIICLDCIEESRQDD